MGAEIDPPIGLGRGQEDPPAIVRHADMAEARPAAGLDADRGAQIDLDRLGAVGPQGPPPFEIARLPGLEGAQEPAVIGKPDIVGNALDVIDGHGGYTRVLSNWLLRPVP
jgi:hypothetical protein